MEEEDLPPGVDDARPAPFGAPAAWISGLDSDAPDVFLHQVGLGYLEPPKVTDFRVAAEYWRSAAVRIGLLPETDATGPWVSEPRQSRGRRSRRSRSASRRRGPPRHFPGEESLLRTADAASAAPSAPLRESANGSAVPAPTPHSQVSVPAIMPAAAAVARPKYSGLQNNEPDRPLGSVGSAPKEDLDKQGRAVALKMGSAVEPVLPRRSPLGRVQDAFRRTVVDMMLRGWDLRLNTRLRLSLAMLVKVVFEVIGIGSQTLIFQPCSLLHTEPPDRSCSTGGGVYMVTWFIVYALINLNSLVLSLLPATLPLAIRIQPYAMLASQAVLSLHHVGYLVGGMSVHGGNLSSSQFLTYRAFFSGVFAAVAALYANAGVNIPAWFEAAAAVFPGVVYFIVGELFLVRVTHYRDVVPPSFSMPTPADRAGAVLLGLVAPVSYFVFSHLLHGGPISVVMRRAKSFSEDQDSMYRGATMVLFSWLFNLLTFGFGCYLLLGAPIGLVPDIDRAVFSRQFFLVVGSVCAAVEFAAMRHVSGITRYSRDMLLGQILPLDAAKQVLQGVTLQQVEDRERKRVARGRDARGREARGREDKGTPATFGALAQTDEGGMSGDSGMPTDASRPQYARAVHGLTTIALDMPQVTALLVRHKAIDCLEAIREIDGVVDRIMDAAGALRLETGTPALVLGVLNIDETMDRPEERGLVLAEALHFSLQELARASSHVSALCQAGIFRCKLAAAAGDALVTVAGARRPLLRFLGPVQTALSLLPAVSTGALGMSGALHGALGSDIQAICVRQSVYNKANQNEDMFVMPLQGANSSQTVGKLLMARSAPQRSGGSREVGPVPQSSAGVVLAPTDIEAPDIVRPMRTQESGGILASGSLRTKPGSQRAFALGPRAGRMTERTTVRVTEVGSRGRTTERTTDRGVAPHRMTEGAAGNEAGPVAGGSVGRLAVHSMDGPPHAPMGPKGNHGKEP